MHTAGCWLGPLRLLAAVVLIRLYLPHLTAACLDWLGGRRTPIPVTKGTDPMAGYLNRFIDIPFPELAGTDDAGNAIVWVRIRNPRLIPTDHLMGGGSKVRLGADGKPVEADIAADETYRRIANLIVAGHVWDAMSLDDDPPLITMPPSPADVGKMPIEICNAIGGELTKSVPH